MCLPSRLGLRLQRPPCFRVGVQIREVPPESLFYRGKRRAMSSLTAVAPQNDNPAPHIGNRMAIKALLKTVLSASDTIVAESDDPVVWHHV